MRMLGYSAACRSRSMTREDALTKLATPPYLEPELLEYVKKRLGYSDAEFERAMNLPRKTIGITRLTSGPLSECVLFFGSWQN